MSWNGVFMAEVQKHECLYNKFCREYRNRELRNECWKNVADKFDMIPMDAEKKFRNIRTAYGRYLKKRRSGTPARGGQDFVPFAFENCEWLAVHIIHRSYESTSSEITSHVDSAGSDDECSPVTMSNIEFLNFAGDYNDVSHATDCDNREISHTVETKPELQEVETTQANDAATTREENTKRVVSYIQQNERSPQPTEIDLSSSLVTKDEILSEPQYLKRTHSNEDEDDLYCRSLALRLKRLRPQAKAYVRIQMEQLLFHTEYSGQTPQIAAPFGGSDFRTHQPNGLMNGQQAGNALTRGLPASNALETD